MTATAPSASAAPNAVATATQTHLVWVDPALAAVYLHHNTRNRPRRRSTVALYARMMAAGEWQVNGETIKFDTTGRLIDGQHRLQAVIESGATVPLLVAQGLAEDSFVTIDTGAKRTAGDLFALLEVTQANLVAAAAALVWRSETGNMNNWYLQPSRAQSLDVIERHPGLVQSATFITSTIGTKTGRWLGRVVPPSVLVALHYLCAQKDEAAAERFFSRLATGADLGVGEPAHVLRARLTNLFTAKVRLSKAEKMALIIKAWNAARTNTRLQMLRWKGGTGKGREAFPAIL